MPETSCSGLYPVVTRDLRFRTSRGTAYTYIKKKKLQASTKSELTFRNSSRMAGSVRHISVTSVIEDSSTPWLRSVRRFLAFAVKWSASSGTFLITRNAHKAAYSRFRARTTGFEGDVPFCECTYCSNLEVSLSHWLNHATFLRRRCLQRCRVQAQRHTCWSGSCR